MSRCAGQSTTRARCLRGRSSLVEVSRESVLVSMIVKSICPRDRATFAFHASGLSGRLGNACASRATILLRGRKSKGIRPHGVAAMAREPGRSWCIWIDSHFPFRKPAVSGVHHRVVDDASGLVRSDKAEQRGLAECGQDTNASLDTRIPPVSRNRPHKQGWRLPLTRLAAGPAYRQNEILQRAWQGPRPQMLSYHFG